jgi:hypothetical protein
MRRRPTARDRDLAEVLRGLKPGRYDVIVEEVRDDSLQFMGLAQLKIEGSLDLWISGLEADRIVHIVPQVSQT